jgi:hypothetical protein
VSVEFFLPGVAPFTEYEKSQLALSAEGRYADIRSKDLPVFVRQSEVYCTESIVLPF